MENRPMNRMTASGLILAIFGGLLAMAPAMAEGYNLVKLAAMAAGGVLIWTGLFRKPLRTTVLDRPLAALWLVMILSALRSVDPPASVFGLYPQAFYGLLPLTICAALFFAGAQISDDHAKDDVLDWLLAASIPLTLFGISQRFLVGRELLLYPRLMDNRIMSTIGAPVMFGACLVPLSVLALHRALEKKSLLGRICAALIAVALLLTWARGAWLSAAAAIAAYLWLTGRVAPRRRHLWILLVLAPAVLVALQRGLSKGDSDSIRVESFKSSLAAMRSRPLLGFGPDTFEFAFRRFRSDELVRVTHDSASIQSNAHNDLLQVAVTLGALGLAAYLWLLWALGARLFALLSAGEGTGRAAAVAAALIGLFIQAKVNPIPPSALMLAGLLAGLVCGGPGILTPKAGRAASSLAAVFCALAVLVLARFCAADAGYKSGLAIVRSTTIADPAYMDGVNRLRRATEINPWWLEYLSARCDVILRVSDIAPPVQGRQLIEKALQLTADAARLHPGNGTAHFMRATALAYSAARFGSGLMPEAQAEIKKASELDPTFTFVMRRRLEIDHALGDRGDYERVNARYREIIAVARESAPWTPLLK
jgi:O-antigen ligase